ncbi:MAG: tetratricopeptide repeat protein [Alphaproteobacteria bacterium]
MNNRQQGGSVAKSAQPGAAKMAKVAKGAQGVPPNAQRMPIQDALANAAKLLNAGRIEQADNLCAQIIKARPTLPDAHNILAVVRHRQGRIDEAIVSLKRAIELNANVANYHSNLGEMERQRGNLDAAAGALKKAVTLDPNSAQAYNNLGIVYYDKREFDKAIESYRKAISLEDKYAEAHNNLGNALRAVGKGQEALKEYESAIEVRENYPEAYNNMGTVLRDMHKLEEAELAYRRAVGLRPEYIEAINNLASLMITQKRYDEALRILSDVHKAHPQDLNTLLNVTRAQLLRGAYQVADRAAKMALNIAPDNVEALCLYGQACHELDRYDDAVASFEKALKIQPNNIEALNFYGVALKSVGRLDDARATFVKALEVQPRAVGTYSNLVDLEKFTPDNPLFKAMVGILGRAKNPEEEHFTALHFALGKAYDDIADYEKSFHHFSTGARLKRKTLQYNEAEVFKFFDDIKAIFNKDFITSRPWEGNQTTLPIFILGMPRSGSTLTEQIISAHPDVFGAGEIKALSMCLGQLRQKYPLLPKYPQMAAQMKPSQFQNVADAYLGFITRVSEGKAKRVTDKLLTNYYFAGFIHMLYPNAKILHTMRNPVDTCWSSFTKLYKDDMPHSYDLRELGRYYRKYMDIMEYWRRTLPPGVMMDVVYEDVVEQGETKAREIVDFLGLPWNDKCLEFHRSERAVKTASVAQVRKPLYKTSVERWRRYGDLLKPLVDAIEGKDENPVPLMK